VSYKVRIARHKLNSCNYEFISHNSDFFHKIVWYINICHCKFISWSYKVWIPNKNVQFWEKVSAQLKHFLKFITQCKCEEKESELDPNAIILLTEEKAYPRPQFKFELF